MIDLAHLEKYRENNRIEAKRAVGGLPYSVWETYSSFANTMGGIILLGVEEGKDKRFRAVDLPDPDGLAAKFWRQLNDPRRVNINILTRRHVRVEQVGEQRIVVIEVPKAAAADKPIYIENDPIRGTYRRGGEGDYRCIPAEIEAMRRAAAVETPDMQLLTDVSISALNMQAVALYRRQMEALRPGHIFSRLDATEFLVQLGAAARNECGIPHPTGAGLLLFGFPGALREIFPAFSLTPKIDPSLYSLKTHTVPGVNDENLFFFHRDMTTLLKGLFPRSTAAAFVLCEALVNCLVNADYNMADSVHIAADPHAISFVNAGSFATDPASAKAGGISDSRNKGLARLFAMIGSGAGIGGGIPRMITTWQKCGHPAPAFGESTGEDRTILTLSFGSKKSTSPKTGTKKRALPSILAKQIIAEYLTDRITATAAEIAGDTGITQGRTDRLLREMQAEYLVIAQGTGKTRCFRLREKAGM